MQAYCCSRPGAISLVAKPRREQKVPVAADESAAFVVPLRVGVVASHFEMQGNHALGTRRFPGSLESASSHPAPAEGLVDEPYASEAPVSEQSEHRALGVELKSIELAVFLHER